MKKIGLLSLALITVLATGAHAAGTGTTWAGVNAGFSLPFGDFADQAVTGFNIGLTGDYMYRENVALGGELGWHTFGGTDDLEKDLTARNGYPTQRTYRIIPITGHAKYLLPSNAQLSPFLKGGLGLYNIKTKTESRTNVEKSTTRVGFQLGGGANFKSTDKVTYGVELLYHHISTAGKATNMLTLRGQILFGFAGR